MEPEQSQNFNERLSQWVASQGFWFQVRYSMSGSGMKGTAMFHLLSMGFRFLIFVLIVAAGSWVYLVKRSENPSFIAGMKDSLQSGLSATDAEMAGFTQIQGKLNISRFACQGGDDSFFSSLEARNIHCKMGLLDGLSGKWDPGIISISRLEVDLRAGADDAESAGKISDALFREFSEVVLNTFEVSEATLRWGYSERTRGSIEGSSLRMQRSEDGLRLVFRGGTFSQNWLRKLEIVNLEAFCSPEGIVLEKAEFRRNGGTVDFVGLKVIGGERPTIQGTAKIRKLALDQVIPSALRNFIEGSFSGDFQVSGSTNTTEGIGFKGTVSLEGEDMITLRERIHILKALSVVDYSRNYHRVDFREGSFKMKTSGGGMEVTDVSLKADDLFTLQGSMKVRLPTAEETNAAVNRGSNGGAPIFTAENGETEEDDSTKKTGGDFSLKRAALEAKRVKEGSQNAASVSLFDRLGMSLEMRRLEEQAAERISRTLRYEGAFKISIPADAFERTPKLAEQFPIDPISRRISMVVPIEGSIYEVTLKQAEDIYQQGRR
jgi:hypothetical protein